VWSVLVGGCHAAPGCSPESTNMKSISTIDDDYQRRRQGFEHLFEAMKASEEEAALPIMPHT
jgi:hypothetical protein